MHLIADIHTHTIASGHAYGTIREMAQAAAECGLQIIGFAEHAPGIPGTCNPFYFSNFEVIPREMHGVKLIHGCEINVLSGGKLSLDQNYIDKLDFAIIGIHKHCYKNEGIVQNTDNLISCMQNEKVKLVAHPDDNRMPLDYERLTDAAIASHTALEVNNSSLVKCDRRLGCYENYRIMLRLCSKKKVPIMVSSDAHDPSQVGCFKLAKELLHEVDFPEELVLNTSCEKLMTFLCGQ